MQVGLALFLCHKIIIDLNHSYIINYGFYIVLVSLASVGVESCRGHHNPSSLTCMKNAGRLGPK